MYIKDTVVSGLEYSIKASGLPMSVSEEPSVSLDRATKLANTAIGSGHDNYLNGIVVHFFIRASNKFWVEMQRYHFIDFISSQSTMHKMKAFDLTTQYIKYVDKRMIDIMVELQETYNNDPSEENFMNLIYSNPCGFELGASMVTNYRQLKTIYHQRKNHRLREWKDFCTWIETLPNSELITGKK